MEKTLQWKCHTPNLLAEIMNNSGAVILRMPLTIMSRLLEQVAIRASQLNDKELNKLMLQLTLYEAADPDSPNYDLKLLKEYSL
jgi:hypothetical protein